MKKLILSMIMSSTLIWPITALAQTATPSLQEGAAAYKNKDYATAVDHFEPFAQTGHAVAQYMMGYMSEKALGGLPQSSEQAVKYFKLSANQGYGRAQFYLATMYRDGKGMDKSLADALFWYKQAELEKHKEPARRAIAQLIIGNFYEKGWSVEPSDEIAVQWYDKAANGGNPSAQFALGLFMAEGRGGVPQSYEGALLLYKMAAEQGLGQAMNSVGVMYEKGQHVPASDDIAFDWYVKAANTGDAFAWSNLGNMYKDGRGVEQSYSEAFKWYHMAADAGEASAMARLGDMYRLGEGVEASKVKSGEYYLEAAELGHNVGQFNLAISYYYGAGVEKSEAKAIDWMQKSHEQKYEPARQKLIEWGVF